MTGFVQSKTYPWALTGIFAAVHLVITLIPFNLSVGGGGEISFGLISAPILGFLLGPVFGTIAVIAGSLLAMFINPLVAVIGPFTALATAAGALAAGGIRTGKAFVVPPLFLIAMGLYLVSPIGVLVPLFVWFHLIAFLLSLTFIIPQLKEKLGEGLESKGGSNRVLTVVSIWLLSIVAVTLDQAVGSGIGPYYFVYVLGFADTFMAGFFELALFLYAFERLVGSVIVTIVLVALGEALSKSNFGLPLGITGPKQFEELSSIEITED